MARYIPYDYRQSSMVVVNFEDQLQAGTFEHAVHYLVDHKLDLSGFDSSFNNDDNGRPAYNPAILLKIILFAYSKGITSSREIQWCCQFSTLVGQSLPRIPALPTRQYLHDEGIEGYIPGNQFRSRDPKFASQKKKYPRPSQAKPENKTIFTASEFRFDPINLKCICPAGNEISFRGTQTDKANNHKAYFVGRLNQCRNCKVKTRCMKNPGAADHRKGHGRQVSFILSKHRKPNFTDWMKHRVDSAKGKLIYSHRMSVVEPVFGNLPINKRLRRFSLRGINKVNGQWNLFCMIQNIEKLANYGKLAA